MKQGELRGLESVQTTGGTDEQLSRLFAEIQADGSARPFSLDQPTGSTEDQPEQRAEEMLDDIIDTLFLDSGFEFDERLVKQSLDELLMTLIAMRTGNTNGKAMMADLTRLFDSQLSPGTVYPALHEMETDGTLEMFELVRSKEYRIDDREAAAGRVTAAARQHLALGAFLYAAAEEL